MKNVSHLVCLLAAAMLFAGCSTAPTSEVKVDELRTAVDNTTRRVESLDPTLKKHLDNTYAYAIFPTVGKGGVIVGGAYGRGEVYERGAMVGWADISQATIGAQLGGQTFTEVILFESQEAFNNFKNNKLKFAANVSAVAMKSGAADSAKYTNGVLVFVEPKAGLMLEAAVGGQSFSYQPK
jgi:lipid-binding SYLF domain-containing protein